MSWRFTITIDRLRAGVWRWQPWLLPLGSLTMVVAMALLVGGGGLPRSLTSLAIPHPCPTTAGIAPNPTSARSELKPYSSPRVSEEGFATARTVGSAGRTERERADAARQHQMLPMPINLEMIHALQQAKFSRVGAIGELPLAPVARLPERLARLEGEDRKKFFIGALLPTVMVAVNEVRQERQQLLAILVELGGRVEEISFSEEQAAWQNRLGKDKSHFILTLVRKYRTSSASELVAMVDVLPPSLIIAQGAIESSWGGSRYAVEANNLFGMFASVAGGEAKAGDSGPRIMEYDSILDSVRAYVLNINRLPAYRELRRIRSRTLDPMRIAEGLSRYSERREYYIKDVKDIIALNKLQDFDTLIHAAG